MVSAKLRSRHNIGNDRNREMNESGMSDWCWRTWAHVLAIEKTEVEDAKGFSCYTF